MVTKKTAKAKGSAAERELLHKFYEEGWGAVRAAGSGSVPLEVPDVIAGTVNRNVAVEIKTCGGTRQYFKAQEIYDLLEFARRFDCEAWVGVKYNRKGWFFVKANELRSSGKNFVLALDYAQKNAMSWEQLINKN